MFRLFSDEELSLLLHEAERNSGEFVKTIIHRHKPKALLLSKSKNSVFYRGVSSRFIEGPIIWFTPHLDPSFSVINDSLKDRLLLFNFHPSNQFIVDELRLESYNVHLLKDVGNDLTDVNSANIFLDLFQHNFTQLSAIADFFKAQDFHTIKLFWSGRDVRAQTCIKQLLKGSEVVTGIGWFDVRNTIELTLTSEMLISLISQRQKSYSQIEQVTENLSVIQSEEALTTLMYGLREKFETLLGENAAQLFPSLPIVEEMQIEDASDVSLPAVEASKREGDSDALIDNPEHTDLEPNVIPPSRAKVKLNIALQAETYLHDLQAAYPFVDYFSQCRSQVKPQKLLLELYSYLMNMPRDSGNQTLKLAAQGQYQDVRPRVCSEPEMYTAYYRYRGSRHGKLVEAQSREFRHEVGGNGYCHHARQCYNAGIIEYLMGILARQTTGPIRWLDIGCGGGRTIHLTNPEKCGVEAFECVGVDLGQTKIDDAKSYISENRRFYCADAFKLPDDVMQGGFHLVTMFEFIEHVKDPIAMIAQAAKLSTAYVMAGSPLDENVTPSQGQEHLWSFSQAGYEQLFTANNLHLVLSNAMKIGQYANNYDWVSCVASHGAKLSDL